MLSGMFSSTSLRSLLGTHGNNHSEILNSVKTSHPFDKIPDLKTTSAGFCLSSLKLSLIVAIKNKLIDAPGLDIAFPSFCFTASYISPHLFSLSLAPFLLTPTVCMKLD